MGGGNAQIVETYGRHYTVRLPDGSTFTATTRKKRVDFACGDWVKIRKINDNQAVIEDYLPRSSLLFRQDTARTKLIAANVSQMLVVAAAEPAPNDILIQRALLAAEAAGIQAALVINKRDLPAAAQYRALWDSYASIGYPVVETCAVKNEIDSLRALLAGHTNIFIGQSGTGKSTLTNVLLKRDAARTGSLSAGAAGRHTTTHSRLYGLGGGSALIDSPGLQSFGLNHLRVHEILQHLPDLAGYIGQCRFHNCTHRNEPDCALKTAAANGAIPQKRLAFLQNIIEELSR